MILVGCNTLGQKNNEEALKSVNFEEISHSQTKTDINGYKVLSSQKAIDDVFFEIAKQSIGDRKPPIPTFENESCLIAISPKLSKSNDVVVTDVLLKNQDIIIKYKENNNTEFSIDSRINPLIVLKIEGECSIKNVQIINN